MILLDKQTVGLKHYKTTGEVVEKSPKHESAGTRPPHWPLMDKCVTRKLVDFTHLIANFTNKKKSYI